MIFLRFFGYVILLAFVFVACFLLGSLGALALADIAGRR